MRGSIRQRGDAWELRVYAGRDPLTGRQRTLTRTFRGTRRQAETALSIFVAEVTLGGAPADLTVNELLHRWLEFARPNLSPTTVRGYELAIRAYVEPTIGEVRIESLRTAQLDQLYRSLQARGGRDGGPLAASSVRQVHAIIRRAFVQATKWGWVSSNPAVLATPPRIPKPTITPPDPDQLITLIEGAEARDPDFGCFLLLAATTGARRGELCALRWDDFDLERGAVTISRSIASTGRGTIEKDTKTHAARHVAIDPGTLQALLALRERARERLAGAGGRLASHAYLFTDEIDGSRPWPPDSPTTWFIDLRKELGLAHFRLHDLRHFAATRLLAAGVPVRTVSGRLGHANAATTLGVYGHFLEASDREAASKLGALLTAGRTDRVT